MKHPWLLILLLLSFLSSYSQITGRVTDTVGNPLQNVNVYDEGPLMEPQPMPTVSSIKT